MNLTGLGLGLTTRSEGIGGRLAAEARVRPADVTCCAQAVNGFGETMQACSSGLGQSEN